MRKYVSASEILPDNLLREIQKYIQGQDFIYPRSQRMQKKVGK